MKKQSTQILLLGILVAALILGTFSSLKSSASTKGLPQLTNDTELLKREAFQILDSKCNICHRRQNPFMVFNERNMIKRASRIYKAVFIEKRMPKGNQVSLTTEEYTKLEQWLFTQNIF